MKEEDIEGEKFERPKLSIQNAPIRGKRRRIVEEDKMGEALALQHSVEAICELGCVFVVVFGWDFRLSPEAACLGFVSWYS